MKDTIKFFVIYAVWCVVLWYVCNALIWVELLMKPYTHTAKTIMIWVEHFLFLTVVPFWATLFTLAAMSGKKKKRG